MKTFLYFKSMRAAFQYLFFKCERRASLYFWFILAQRVDGNSGILNGVEFK